MKVTPEGVLTLRCAVSEFGKSTSLIELLIKGHMKRYFVISLDMVFLHIKYVFEYLTNDSS